jgi:hypothetical protein
MTKLLITTQVYENYAWREDGTIGTGADAYFKPKGGHEYVVRGVDEDQVFEVLEKVALQVEQANDYFQEFIVDTKIVDDDYLTEYERDQLEYDGEIMFPAKELTVEAL